MRKVDLRMNEQEKYKVIKELIDSKGNKNRAALKLGISIRQINRLIRVYKEKGKSGFVHKNRSRQPVNSLPQDLTDYIIKLSRVIYQDFNFARFRMTKKRQFFFKLSFINRLRRY